MRIENDNYWHNAAPLHDEPESRRGFARELIEMVVLSLFIFFIVRDVVPTYRVDGQSMMPTLEHEQRVFVNRGLYFRYDANFLARLADPAAPADMRYLFHGPQRGDIVVFEAPLEEEDFIKRVIALEGETVEVKPDEGVFLNGVKLNEPYIQQAPDYSVTLTEVPAGHVFVLGDNRRNSSDSHVWGALSVDRIVGTAFVSFWPQERVGLIPHPTYAEIEER